VVTRPLQIERRTGKVRWPETDVLPLYHAANPQLIAFCLSMIVCVFKVIQCHRLLFQPKAHHARQPIIGLVISYYDLKRLFSLFPTYSAVKWKPLHPSLRPRAMILRILWPNFHSKARGIDMYFFLKAKLSCLQPFCHNTRTLQTTNNIKTAELCNVVARSRHPLLWRQDCHFCILPCQEGFHRAACNISRSTTKHFS